MSSGKRSAKRSAKPAHGLTFKQFKALATSQGPTIGDPEGKIQKWKKADFEAYMAQKRLDAKFAFSLSRNFLEALAIMALLDDAIGDDEYSKVLFQDVL